MALTSLYPQQGLQNFIDEASNILTAINGVPGAGQFRSTITNRASITDISQNLRPQIGIDRIAIQQAILLQNEFGSSGESVYKVLNDDRDLIRFVASNLSSTNDIHGPQVVLGSGDTTSYCEVTFYGTGLNLLQDYSSASRDIRATIDNGSEGSNLYTVASDVLAARNYAVNSPLSIASGLTLGIHTIKIRNNNSNGTRICGFEILNESTSIKTNPGSAYVNGRKNYLAAQDSAVYNTGFTNTYGSAGTRGGHVLVYLASDGTVKKDIQYVEASSATLASADHTNEEVVRRYSYREFGAGRTDDYSSVLTTNARYFTLDDGTTTLSGTAVKPINTDTLAHNANGEAIILTFVGTGLDIIQQDNTSGGSDSYNIQVDGGSTIALPTAGNSIARQVKLVSGLPYGTHTVKINRVSVATWNLGINAFIVYQPKKPALPAGAIELADYNVMANYSQSAGSSFFNGVISSGVILKSPSREHQYVGSTWSLVGNSYNGGFYAQSTNTTDTAQLTFVGTGVEISVNTVGATTQTFLVKIDGSNYTGAATAVGLSGTNAWTPGTSTWQSGGGTLSISGLTYGSHTVTFNCSSLAGGSAWLYTGADIITPVHSQKSNLFADLQNSLPIGSCTISDNRITSPIQTALSSKKAWAQAVGISSSPTTTSASAVPIPDMSATIKTNGGPLELNFMGSFSNSSVVANIFQFFVDGVAVGVGVRADSATGADFIAKLVAIAPVSAGVHKVDVYWTASGGTLSAHLLYRTLTVREL